MLRLALDNIKFEGLSMNMKKLLAFSSFSLMALLFTDIAFAGFVVRNSAEPCESEMYKQEYYGNAQTPRFRTALGRGEMDGEEIPPEELMELEEQIPSIEYNSWYLRVRGHLSKRRVSKIKNDSSEVWEGLAVAQPSVEEHVKGVEVAIGYVWPDWRFDIEYIFLKAVNYNPNPVLTPSTGVPNNFSAEINTDALLANFYYEFLQHDRLRPYAFFGFGLAVNKSSMDFNDYNKTVKKLGIAWSFGVGAKFRIVDRLYIDAAFRQSMLGKAQMFNDNALHLKGKSTLTGVSAGLLFLI